MVTIEGLHCNLMTVQVKKKTLSHLFLGEKAELKAMLSKKYGHFKVKDIRSSKLWSHMQGGKKKDVKVQIVPASELRCCQREG